MGFWYSLSGTCFICNEKFEFVSSQEDIEGRKISFKMFLRYLGVNLLEHLSSGAGENLCQWCSSRLNGFWQLYQEFENLRLCLDDYVQGFLERMKTTRENPHENSQREQSEETTNDKLSQLREAVIKRCTFKIYCTPLIKLKRTNVSQPQPTAVINSPSPSITSQDIKVEVSHDSIDDSHEDHYSSSSSGADDHDELSSSSTRKRIKIHILTSKKPLKNEKISPATTYTCQTCKESFQNFKTYLFHKRSHQTNETKRKKMKGNKTKTKPELKCEICKLVCSDKNNLDLHKVALHLMEFHSSKIPPGTKKAELKEATRILISKKKIYSTKEVGCPFCSRLFKRDTKLGYHLQLKHFDKVLLTLKNPEDSSLHKVHLEHKKSRRDPKKSTLNNDKIANLKYKKIPGATPFQCCICETSYSRLRLLKIHSLLKHTVAHLDDKFSPGITQKDVDTCINSFLSESETHPGGKLSCPLCSLVEMKTKLKLHLVSLHLDKIIHRISHHSKSPHATDKKTVPEKKPKEKVYTCPTCQKVFRKYKLFLVHKTNHKTGYTRKPVKCTLCDIVFSQKQGFQRHSVTIHTFPYLQDKLPPDTTQDGLNAAVDSYLSEAQPINDGEKWRCLVCSKEFIERCYFRTHILMCHLDKIIHRLKEPVPVAVASVFSSDTKSSKFSIKCWTCGDFYGSQKNLEIHRKLEHPGGLECFYCKQRVTKGYRLSEHVLESHTFHYFKDKLPPQTTENEFERVIDEVVSEEGVVTENNGRCPLCSVDLSFKSSLRKHVLYKHFSEVVSLLDSKNHIL